MKNIQYISSTWGIFLENLPSLMYTIKLLFVLKSCKDSIDLSKVRTGNIFYWMIKWRTNYCCEIWPEWHYIFCGNCRISKETYLVLSHDNIKRYRLYIYRDMLFSIEMMLPVMILHWYLFHLTLSYFFFIKWFRTLYEDIQN